MMKFTVGLLLMAMAAGAQGQTPVAHLDLKRYAGQWYEVARFPDKGQKGCVGDAFVLYALGDRPLRFSLVTSCRRKDGSQDVRNKDGRSQDRNGNGALRLAALWPFSTKYWVLALDPEYQWALVGTPNRRKLWVLSRTNAIAAETLAAIEAQAAAQGFDVTRLVAGAQSEAHAAAQ